MFGTKSAAILILASLSAPAMAASGGFCDRIAAKLSAPTAVVDDIEILEHDLRLSIRRAAEDGCDPFGGMTSDQYCAAHVMQIRDQVAEIQQAELEGPDNAETLQAMYDGANCAGREQGSVVRLGDEVELLRGSVVTIAPDAEAAEQPDSARFDLPDAAEPSPDTSVRTASVQPAPIAHVVSEPLPIPAERRDVRVIGSRFLTDADSTRTFKTIATSERDLPSSLLNRVLSLIGLDGASPGSMAEAPSASSTTVQ